MTAHPTISTHAKATLALGIPLIGSSLAQMALHVADTVMVGWYGVVPLAAVVLGSSTFFIMFILGAGFAKAVLPLVASAIAAGDEAQVRRDARMALWLSAAFGVLIYPVFWFSGPILRLLGQQPEVIAIAETYLQITGLGLIPALWVATLQSWLAAQGRTQVVLWVTLGAVVLNVGINWALIFGNWGFPALGALGAAVATFSVQVVSFIILAFYAALLPSLRKYHLFQRFWRADWPAMGRVFRLGWPIGLTGIAEGSLFQASAIMMGWLGAVPLAAHGIALEAAAVAFMIHVGLSSAATIRIAAYAETGEARALRDAALVALALSFLVGAVVIAGFLTWPSQIISLFLDTAKPESAAILTFGMTLLAVAALFQMADAMQVMALGLLRGLQDTKVPMILAAVSYWVIGVPVSYALAFPLGFGGVGLWFGLVVGLVAAGGSLMMRFWMLAPKARMAGEPAL